MGHGTCFMWLLELWICDLQIWKVNHYSLSYLHSAWHLLVGSSSLWPSSGGPMKEAGLGGWGLETVLVGESEEGLGPSSKSASY